MALTFQVLSPGEAARIRGNEKREAIMPHVRRMTGVVRLAHGRVDLASPDGRLYGLGLTVLGLALLGLVSAPIVVGAQ